MSDECMTKFMKMKCTVKKNIKLNIKSYIEMRLAVLLYNYNTGVFSVCKSVET